jgi:hypothetical protein
VPHASSPIRVGGNSAEELRHLAAPQLPEHNRLVALVDAGHVKDMFGCIHSNPENGQQTASLAEVVDKPQSRHS